MTRIDSLLCGIEKERWRKGKGEMGGREKERRRKGKGEMEKGERWRKESNEMNQFNK